MKARITPDVIGELRHRVIAHNERLSPALRETGLTRLQTLKGLYKRWYGGANPHMHALVLIDRHLAKVRGETLEPLGKAEERDEKGRFIGQGGFYGDVAKPEEHRQLQDQNAGYDAAQTQVIPETRYSVFGPRIAGAAGYAGGAVAGAALGATARVHNPFKEEPASAIDRVITRGLGGGGAYVGRKIAGASEPLIVAGHTAARHGIGAINRTLHTTYPRPASGSHAAITQAVMDRGEAIGRASGRGIGHAQSFLFAGPTGGARKAIEYGFHAAGIPHGVRAGRIGGGILGAAILGSTAGPTFVHVATNLGPYLDAAFPRRVRKMAGPLYDDEEVLAKIDALGALDLNKADVVGALRGAATAGGAAGRRIIRTLFPSIANHTAGPLGAFSTVGNLHGNAAFRAAGNFQVGRFGAAQARDAATHALGLAGVGAGVGAISGAAGVAAHDLLFAEKHPRDPHGRFATKSQGAKTGARIGGSIGLGIGLLGGIAAARQGHGAVLADAITRLTAAIPAMREAASAGAREAHARQFLSEKGNAVGQLAPSGTKPLHEELQQALETTAGTRFDASDMARAIKGGPQAWYTHLIDEGFSRRAQTELRKITDAAGDRTPLLDKAGNRIPQHASNLLDQLDPEKLNPGQRKLWDGLVAERKSAVENVEAVYERRKGFTQEITDHVATLKAEKAQLTKDIDFVPERAQELEQGDEPLSAIRRFAQDRLGHALKARTKAEAIPELRDVIHDWDVRSNERLKAIEDEIDITQQTAAASRSTHTQDLTDAERMAIVNPYAGSRQAKFFPAPPDIAVARKSAQVAASRDFVRDSLHHAVEASNYTLDLAQAQGNALKTRIPNKGLTVRQFERFAPILAARLHQANVDYATLTSLRRASMTGRQKQFYDWLHANQNPTQALNSARGFSRMAQTGAARAIGFGARNFKTLVSIGGIAGGIGAFDITGPKGKRVRVNPKDWHRPQGMRVEFERPNANEALVGLSYRDRDNQQRFLHGIHVQSGGRYQHVFFGQSVNDVRNRIRGQGGQGGPGGPGRPRAEDVSVANVADAEKAVQNLRSQNGLVSAGPPDFQYRARAPGHPTKELREAVDGFYKQHLEQAERFKGQSTNNPNRYWGSLRTLFEGKFAELMSVEDRARLLTGTGQRRGIFANRNAVFKHPQQADKTQVKRELLHQIGVHTPTNIDEYRQLKRAMWTASQHYDLSDADKREVMNELEKHYEGATAKDANETRATPAAAGSRERVAEIIKEAFERAPDPTERHIDYRPDEELENFATKIYRTAVATGRHLHGASTADPWTDLRIHEEARKKVMDAVDDTVLDKSERIADLAKYLSWPGGDDVPKVPKAPKVPGMPAIGGAAASQVPAISGSAKPRRQNIAQSTGASHQISQLGSYGLGNLATALVPEARPITSWVAGGAAALGGGYGGRQLGIALGDKKRGESVGDPQSTNETLARTGAGITGNLVGEKFGHVAAKVGLRAAPGQMAQDIAATPGNLASKVGNLASKAKSVFSRGNAAVAADEGIAGAAGRAATQGTFERLGSEIGGDVGGVGGAIAGEAVDPAGGGIPGRVGGRALGLAIGAGAGWLADEGVGLLYRHLGGYGPHVAAMAAKSIGAQPRRQIAVQPTGATQPGAPV